MGKQGCVAMRFDANKNNAFDNYQKILNHQRMQTGLSAVQTAVTSQMAGSLHQLQGEMAAIHEMNLEGLAIQQEMLQREHLQSHLEEFIYNTQKMVTDFSDEACSESTSARYFGLKGVAETVKQLGIGTALIRGRDNKAAFEAVLKDVKKLTASLETDQEVIDAIEWTEAEKQRRIEAKRKQKEEQEELAAEQRKQQRLASAEKDARRNDLMKQIAKLKSERKTTSITFASWHNEKFGAFLNRQPPFEAIPIANAIPQQLYTMLAYVVLWYLPGFGFAWIPFLYSSTKSKAETDLNSVTDGEIARREKELAAL